MLGPNDLVLCSGTLLNGSLQDLVAAAVAGDYRGITLWPQDVHRAHTDGLTDADIRRLLADNDLIVAGLDPLLGWTEQGLPGRGEARIELATEEVFYAIAENIGGQSLNVAHAFGTELDLDRAAEDLAGVCDRAREHGLVVTVEFLPWSGIPDAAAALDLVTRVGRDNATLMVDTWHWFRTGADLDQLRALPGEKVGGIQLNDCLAEPWDDLQGETMAARLNPGEGVVPLDDVIRVLDEIGSTAPIGVEVFNDRHDRMTPTEVGRSTAEATRSLLERVRAGERRDLDRNASR